MKKEPCDGSCVIGQEVPCENCGNKANGKTMIMDEPMSDSLCNDLCKILMDYCGETGENEGAVQTLERKLREHARMKKYIEECDCMCVGTKDCERCSFLSSFKL